MASVSESAVNVGLPSGGMNTAHHFRMPGTLLRSMTVQPADSYCFAISQASAKRVLYFGTTATASWTLAS